MSEVSREEHEALVVQVAALRDRVNQLEWKTQPIGGVLNTQVETFEFPGIVSSLVIGVEDTSAVEGVSESGTAISADSINLEPWEGSASTFWDDLQKLQERLSSNPLYIPHPRYRYPVYKEPSDEEAEALKEKLRNMTFTTPALPALPPVQHYQELVFDGWPVANVVRFLLELLHIPKADWPQLPGSGFYAPFVPGSAAALEDAGLPRVATGTGLQPKCRIKIVVEEE